MIEEFLKLGVQAAKAGNYAKAQGYFSKVVQTDPSSELGWLYLGHSLNDETKKVFCYRKVLSINPNNQRVSNELEKISSKKSTPSTLQSIKSSDQSRLPNQDQVKKLQHYMSIIIGTSALIIISLIAYSIIKGTTKTITSAITRTLTLATPNKVVDAYLTAIEKDNWEVAYDYLCPEIQAQIRTPDDMYRRILTEIGSIPDSHTILPPPDRPYRVLFIMSRTDEWSTTSYGTREARLEESSLKICGIGFKHGDLRYLLQPENIGPLNINP